jgi:hypothetical protein
MLAAENYAQTIQIFGYYIVVVNWMNGINKLYNLTLKPIFEKVELAKTTYNNIYFHHVLRERKVIFIMFSKK